MPRSLLPASALAVAVLLALAICPFAGAAAPTGFSPPQTLGTNLQVYGAIAAADAAGGQPAAVAFADRANHVWAARVGPDGSVGSPLLAGSYEPFARDVQAVVTDRGELVVAWAASRGTYPLKSAVRYAVAAPGAPFGATRTLAAVGSYTSATPRIAALSGGSVGVIFRDTHPPRPGGVLRYAHRPPFGVFGNAQSLGHDGVSPEIQGAPGGRALLAWAQGPLLRRALMIAPVRRGAQLPDRASSVAGSVKDITLTASSDGTAWVTWTRRAGRTGFARRVAAGGRVQVGPIRAFGAVTYGVPRVALAGDSVLAAWSGRGPDLTANVGLAAAQGTRDALGAPTTFDAGGFSQTSPTPAFHDGTPLVLFTRQIASTSGAQAQAVAADPATGELTPIADAGSIATPAVAHSGSTLLVAWAAVPGGVAVSALP